MSRLDVVLWVSQAVAQTLAGWGLRNEPGAPLVLQGELLKLFAAEHTSYDMIDWKKAGVPHPAIKAAVE